MACLSVSVNPSRRALMSETNYEIYPLKAPGMPFVGLDFVAAAREVYGDDISIDKGSGKSRKAVYGPILEGLIRRALYDQGDLTINVTVKGTKKKPMPVIAGHRWGRDPQGYAAG